MPLADFPTPDYNGHSLVNLMASIIRARGGKTPHRPLRGLPQKALQTPRIILLLLDGLGEEQLADYLALCRRRKRPSPFFGAHPRRVISSICPATTAAAVTTLSTGASPTEHAILGWHLHLPDLGLVGTPLPFTTRTGTPLAPADFPLQDYLAHPAYLASIPGTRHLLSSTGIPTSPTSRAQPWWTRRTAYTTLTALHRHLLAAARGKTRAYTYAYWPLYDTLCHRHGPASPIARAHLAELDATLARLTPRLADTGTRLLITADHGHMATAHTLNLARIPGFYDTLAMLPSGDARLLHCFVRPRAEKQFLTLVKNSPIAEAAACITGEDALSAGLFGPGKPHPALRNRLGDYLLLARPAYALHAPPACAKKDRPMRGTHGGLSTAELHIPLFVI